MDVMRCDGGVPDPRVASPVGGQGTGWHCFPTARMCPSFMFKAEACLCIAKWVMELGISHQVPSQLHVLGVPRVNLLCCEDTVGDGICRGNTSWSL